MNGKLHAPLMKLMFFGDHSDLLNEIDVFAQEVMIYLMKMMVSVDRHDNAIRKTPAEKTESITFAS